MLRKRGFYLSEMQNDINELSVPDFYLDNLLKQCNPRSII